MPWKEVTKREEKMRFVGLLKTNRYTVSELYGQLGISRKTGYKCLERCEEESRSKRGKTVFIGWWKESAKRS
jgi:transposase-like protein